MRDDYKEQLSALVDDELRAEESRFLTARLGDDASARAQLGRYVMIRHALQGSLAMDESGDPGRVANGVARALDDEPAHSGEPPRGKARRWLQPAAGIAVAASVALLTIGLWPGEQRPGGPPSAATDGAAVTARLGDPARPVSEGRGAARPARTVQASDGRQRMGPEMRQRLNSYMVNHSEHSATGGVGTVLTYVRIAGHDPDE